MRYIGLCAKSATRCSELLERRTAFQETKETKHAEFRSVEIVDVGTYFDASDLTVTYNPATGG